MKSKNSMNISEKARELGLPRTTVAYRVKHDIPLDKPVRKLYTVDGLSGDIRFWAKRLCLEKKELRDRIHYHMEKRGLSENEALKWIIDNI